MGGSASKGGASGSGTAGAAGGAGSGGKEHHDCGWVAPGATFYPIPAANVGICRPPNVEELAPIQKWTVWSIPNEKNLKALFAFTITPANPSPDSIFALKPLSPPTGAGAKIGWDSLPVAIKYVWCNFAADGKGCELTWYEFTTVPLVFSFVYEVGAGDILYAIAKSVEKL